jgi:hypothetical protein
VRFYQAILKESESLADSTKTPSTDKNFSPVIQESPESSPVALFLFHQLVRHGVMTMPQILTILQGRLGRSRVYERISRLREDGYIKRVAHPTKDLFAYCATPLAYEALYERKDGLSARSRFKLRRRIDLGDIALETFGARRPMPGIAAESVRTRFGRETQYLPLVSLQAPEIRAPLTPTLRESVTESEKHRGVASQASGVDASMKGASDGK